MAFFLKDPAASIDYAVDWGAGYLGAQVIVQSAWSVEPGEPGGVVVNATVRGDRRSGATLGGGVPGHVYRVTNRVTLSDGRIDERGIALRVEQR